MKGGSYFHFAIIIKDFHSKGRERQNKHICNLSSCAKCSKIKTKEDAAAISWLEKLSRHSASQASGV